MPTVFHDLEYMPRELSRSAGDGFNGIWQRLLRAGSADSFRLTAAFQRWWALTTDVDYLLSSVSRRDLWRVVLPVSGLLIMFADFGGGNAVVLDFFAAVLLWATSFLPPNTLWPDSVVGCISTMYVVIHDGIAASEPGVPTFQGCQFFILFAMASTGIHTTVLITYFVTTLFASGFLLGFWDGLQFVGCIFACTLSFINEKRVAEYVSDRHLDLGSYDYKALDTSHRFADTDNDFGPSVGAGDVFTYATLRHGDFVGSNEELRTGDGNIDVEDLEEGACPPPVPESVSHASLTDYVLSRISPPEGTQSAAAATEFLFARLSPAQRSQYTHGDPAADRCIATKVRMPSAAHHEGPVSRDDNPHPRAVMRDEGVPDVLPEHSDIQRQVSSSCPDVACTRHALLSRDSAAIVASGARAGEPPVGATLQGVKLAGFQTPGLNDLFVESTDPEVMVNGRKTYWSSTGDYFLYRNESTGTWGAAKAKRFKQVRSGRANGLAHSPEGFEIWQPSSSASAKKPWREWDFNLSKWVVREGSGVQSRGQVRRKHGPNDKEVQVKFPGTDQCVQTDTGWMSHLQ